MKRTLLPLNALRVYDAAARHLSFTKAADELAVTPAAVGQQIRALEDHLGTVLFRRTSKGLELTEEGSAGLDALRDGFLRFEESVAAMQAGQAVDRYAIAAPRGMLENWLAPRLAAFQAQHPGVRFQLRERERADFSEANLDLAIWLTEGPEEFPGEQISQPQWVSVAPVDAPDAKGRTIGWPGDGGSESRDSAPEACIAVGSAGQALASVIAGLGTARVPFALAAEAIAAGTVTVEDGPQEGRRSYWLVAPPPQWRQKKVRALVQYLTGTL
ncbi:LysR family transcriptional regulator [Citromicrobium bathyomarinum]|uniref:LysR family transcriptional regulator n=1 Tax=Citromicrobium bathyomarinum TaxID=72174 RepID=UPI003159F6B6